MAITTNDIDIYLTDVKDAIRKNRYRMDLFINYVIVVSLHEQKYPMQYYFK